MVTVPLVVMVMACPNRMEANQGSAAGRGLSGGFLLRFQCDKGYVMDIKGVIDDSNTYIIYLYHAVGMQRIV